MKCFCKIPSLVVSLGLWVLIVSVAVVPRAKAQSSAPGTGISGNRIIATTAGTLGLHSVMAGQTLDLRGVNFSGQITRVRLVRASGTCRQETRQPSTTCEMTGT